MTGNQLLLALAVWCFTFSCSQAAPFVLDARSVGQQQIKRQRLTIPIVQKQIKVDGNLSDTLWKEAVEIKRFREYPAKNPFPVDARFQIAANEKHVFVGFTVTHPAGADAALKTPKGGDEYGGSLIEIFFDPSGVGKQKRQFICNPLGLRYDSLDSDKQWDGTWRSAGNVREDGWSVEVAIPIADLGQDAIRSGQRLTANFAYVGPRDLHLSWTGAWGSPTSDYADVVFDGDASKSAPANLLPNPGFENVSDKSPLPQNWFAASKPNGAIVAVDKTSAQSGQHGLHLEFPKQPQPKGGNDIIAYTMVGPGFDAGKTYTFSAYVKTKSLDGYAYLDVYQYPAPFGPQHQLRSKELRGDHDWTRLSVTFKAREKIDRLQLRCGVHTSDDKKQGAVWFDDAKLEMGDKPTKFVEAADPVLHVKRFSLWLDREVYDLRDVTAVGLLRVDADGMSGADNLSLRVKVVDGQQEVVQETLPELPGLKTDLTLGMSQLSIGSYKLVAELLRGDGKVLATATRPFAKRQRPILAKGAKSGRIPLRVWAVPQADGTQWPISTGVPFAQGTLTSADDVRLIGPDGKEVPCQTSVRATWNRRGSIQWLGVDFVPTLGETEQAYALEYGPKVKQAKFDGLSIDSNENEITVNTGPLQFTINRKSFRLIDRASIDQNKNGNFEDSENVVAAKSSPALVDHQGTRYTTAADRDVEVVVEEQGPVKVVIRASGWYVKEGSDGKRISCELPTDRLCKFKFRITAWAGQPTIHIAASNILTFDSDKVRLRDLGLGLGIVDGRRVRIGTDAEQPITWDAKRLNQSPHFVQHRWDAAFDDQNNELPRADGWIEVSGSRVDTVLAVRNFWRLFPKELEWNDGSLLLHLWPAHARDRTFGLGEELDLANIYKLWYCHQGKELGFQFPETYVMRLDEELKKNPNAFGSYYKAMEYSNAQGLCIHNDFVIGFRSESSKTASEDFGKQLSHLVDNGPHAYPDPEYACATGVFGPMLHADWEKYGHIEETLRDGFRSLSTRTKPNNEFGQFIFGGGHTYWQYHRQPSFAGVHRVWINGHYQIPRVPYVQYFRTGDPFYLKWGRNYSANLRDIGMVHYVSDERRFRYHTLGAMYHCKGFAPWAGDSHVAAHLISMDHLLYDFLMTGNHRSRDAFLTWVEGLKRTSPGGYGTREGIGALGEMLEAYRFTWDPELLEIMDRFARQIFGNLPLAEQHWWDYHPLLLPRYYGLTGSEKALSAYRQVRESSRAKQFRSTRSAFTAGSHIDGYLAMLDSNQSAAQARGNSPTPPDQLADWQGLIYKHGLSCVRQPDIYASGHTHHQWLEFVYPCHKIPYLLKAMDRFGLTPERPRETLNTPLPTNNLRSIVHVRESVDREFPIEVRFARMPSGQVKVRVTSSSGIVGTKQWTPIKDQPPRFQFLVPKDGRRDDYHIELSYTGSYDTALWPLTPLAHEVAILPKGQNRLWAGNRGTRLYFAGDSEMPSDAVITSDSKRAMGMELLNSSNRVLQQISDSRYVGKPTKVNFKQLPNPNSVYFSDMAEMRFNNGRLIVALTRDRFFDLRSE